MVEQAPRLDYAYTVILDRSFRDVPSSADRALHLASRPKDSVVLDPVGGPGITLKSR